MSAPSQPLLYFTGGGPLDGLAYPQAQVFGEKTMLPGADQYEDTTEFKRSEKNPDLIARVWRWKEQRVTTNLEQTPVEPADIAPRDDLRARRGGLRLSRDLVADRAGLAPSKVAAIENGTGKRIKAEEIAALENALTAMEQEAAARAHG